MEQISTGDSNRIFFIKSCASAPITAAGMVAMTRPKIKRREFGFVGKVSNKLKSFAEYTEKIARIAPNWINTSKVRPVLSNPRKCPTKSKCPVDETGMNSVSPSIIPRIMGNMIDSKFTKSSSKKISIEMKI